jgi:hypothetical protein
LKSLENLTLKSGDLTLKSLENLTLESLGELSLKVRERLACYAGGA